VNEFLEVHCLRVLMCVIGLQLVAIFLIDTLGWFRVFVVAVVWEK